MRSVIFDILPTLSHKNNSFTQTFLFRYDEGYLCETEDFIAPLENSIEKFKHLKYFRGLCLYSFPTVSNCWGGPAYGGMLSCFTATATWVWICHVIYKVTLRHDLQPRGITYGQEAHKAHKTA